MSDDSDIGESGESEVEWEDGSGVVVVLVVGFIVVVGLVLFVVIFILFLVVVLVKFL